MAAGRSASIFAPRGFGTEAGVSIGQQEEATMARQTGQLVAIGFIAGAIGVLIFHQAIILLMYLLGLLPSPPYSMKATAPFGVPQILSSAFWGGLWGIALVWLMSTLRAADRLWVAVLFGGVLPTLVGILVVTPLKGGDPVARLQLAMLSRGFLINGVWGLGAWLSYRVARRILR
jgi:hypothetical protein